MKKYFEAHVTMIGDAAMIRPLVEATKWKFSAIDGDINLGEGVKCYATRQFNLKIGESKALTILHETADSLVMKNVNVIRRKIEIVIYDDRQGVCTGACPEYIS